MSRGGRMESNADEMWHPEQAQRKRRGFVHHYDNSLELNFLKPFIVV